MTTRSYGSQRKRSPSVSIVTLGILVLGLIGGALILQAGGVIQIPLLTKKTDAPEGPDYTGLIPVPRSVRTIPAYSEITRDHIMDQQGNIAWLYLRPGDVTKEMLTKEDLGKVIGRVLRRAKPPNYVFTEADFYPPGTRPGPTAGVPVGKRALRLKASDVPGLHGLNQFDRFDLVMTVEVEVEEERARGGRSDPQLDVDGPYSELAERTPAPAAPAARVKRKHAEVKTIVNNGIVVQPVTERQQIGTSSSLLRGSSLTRTPVEEIIIAVEPDEVAALNLAMAIDAQLQVAMRTGQVSADLAAEGEIRDIEVVLDQREVEGVDDSGAVTHVRIVEVIQGGRKHLMAVPRSTNGSTTNGTPPSEPKDAEPDEEEPSDDEEE